MAILDDGQSVFSFQFSDDLLTTLEIVAVADDRPVEAISETENMAMGVGRIVMPEDEVGVVVKAHFSHILLCYI